LKPSLYFSTAPKSCLRDFRVVTLQGSIASSDLNSLMRTFLWVAVRWERRFVVLAAETVFCKHKKQNHNCQYHVVNNKTHC
jgi:hypothetical protein